MSKLKRSPQLSKSFSPLLVAGLMVAGNFHFIPQALALGAPAGTVISNTATATYDEPGGAELTTTSNTVEVTVAEIAGITLTPSAVTNLTDPANPVSSGDSVRFDFILENVGNDPSKFVLPTSDTLNSNANAVENGEATLVTYEILNPDGTTTPVANGDIDALALANGGAQNAETISLDPGQRLLVSVTATADPGLTTGDNFAVNLGNTPTIGDQNVARGANTDDVYTVDNDDGSVVGETNGVPLNGTREASATNSTPIDAETPRPFAKIQKTSGLFNDTNGDGAVVAPEGDANDAEVDGTDTLPYTLTLDVAADDTEIPAALQPLFAPEALQPTAITGLTDDHVLVSDVLPEGTQLDSEPVAPADWDVVYSDTDPATATGPSASWTTTLTDLNGGAGTLADVTQIGFIFIADDGPADGTPDAFTAADGSVDFDFTINFASGYTPGDEVRNIALVYGEDSGDNPIFDESGDDQFNNDSNEDGTPEAPSDPTGDPTNGDDTNNDNTGTGDGGEDNVFDLPLPDAVLEGILNGTVQQPGGTLTPGAIGPTDNNDDFTNKTSVVTDTDIPSVSFDNSLSVVNDGDVTLTLDPTLLGDLPAGESIIIFERNDGTQVTYTVNKTSPSGSTAGISLTSPPSPLTISVTAGTPVQYAVKIDLPEDTPRLEGYDVPVIAFLDTDTDGVLDADESRNITIDRVYTGFVRLVKTSQILDATGTPVADARGTLDTTAKAIQEGEIIRYVVTYSNVSEAQPGAPGQDNITLTASNLVVTENGTIDGNNWALDLDGDGVMDTLATDTPAAPVDSTGGTIAITGTAPEITIYVDTVGSLAPAASGTFTFHRVFDQSTIPNPAP